MATTMRVLGMAAIAVLIGGPLAAQTSGPAGLELRTLSTKPETVSGGQVLVQIGLPGTVAADRVAVTLNGRDVRSAFRPGNQPQTLIGLVAGLTVGSNQIEASAPGERRAQVTVVSHPITGPVIAGPHQTPFVCETEAFGLGPATDGNCSVQTRVDYFYRVRAAATPQLESPVASSAAALWGLAMMPATVFPARAVANHHCTVVVTAATSETAELTATKEAVASNHPPAKPNSA